MSYPTERFMSYSTRKNIDVLLSLFNEWYTKVNTGEGLLRPVIVICVKVDEVSRGPTTSQVHTLRRTYY